MIAIFAYDFPHRKTHDFLLQLAGAGIRDVLTLAAPWRELKSIDRTAYISRTLRPAPSIATATLCRALGFRHETVDHRDCDTVCDLLKAHDARLGLISGARILKQPVIEACPEGIVNFHPGALPETSGLDALFYTFSKGIAAGVTTHFIDSRIDAGARLAFDELSVGLQDSVETVQENLYQLQITALRRVLNDWQNGDLRPSPINRPSKNAPMTADEKYAALAAFPAWRAAQAMREMRRELFSACEAGKTSQVLCLLDKVPDFIEARSPEGWTPLIVAAFHQYRELVCALLDRGADPNATGRKGTTALMYAKTALLGQDNPDTRLLERLLAAGADPDRHDMHGRTVSDYIDPTTDAWLINLLRTRGSA